MKVWKEKNQIKGAGTMFKCPECGNKNMQKGYHGAANHAAGVKINILWCPCCKKTFSERACKAPNLKEK